MKVFSFVGLAEGMWKLGIAYMISITTVDKLLLYGFLMMLGMIYSGIGFYSGYIGRMSTFFWVFIIIGMVNLVNQLFKQERDKLLVNCLIAVSYFVLYFAVFGFDEILPYSF